jgi:hypothetical protein
MKFVTLHSGGLGVQGTGWGRGTVTLSLQTGPWTVGLTVRPNARGKFRVALQKLNPCAGADIHAYDARGRSVELRRRDLQCPTPAELPRPVLHAVVGKSTAPATVQILAARPASVTLHVGTVLYLWEPGTTAPAFRPQLTGNSSTLLVLVDAGQTAPRACAQVDCAAGFYWKWVAVSAGDAGISLSAACRSSSPPCMLPDYLIRVQIVP